MLSMLSLWTLWTAVQVIGVMGSQIRVLRRSLNRRRGHLSDLPRATALSGQIKKWRCHFNPSGQGQVAAHLRQSLVFLRQHDSNDRFAVIARAEDQFQGEPLALCCTPVSRNAI